jgi:ribosomal protein L16/L10AE
VPAVAAAAEDLTSSCSSSIPQIIAVAANLLLACIRVMISGTCRVRGRQMSSARQPVQRVIADVNGNWMRALFDQVVAKSCSQ